MLDEAQLVSVFSYNSNLKDNNCSWLLSHVLSYFFDVWSDVHHPDIFCPYNIYNIAETILSDLPHRFVIFLVVFLVARKHRLQRNWVYYFFFPEKFWHFWTKQEEILSDNLSYIFPQIFPSLASPVVLVRDEISGQNFFRPVESDNRYIIFVYCR